MSDVDEGLIRADSSLSSAAMSFFLALLAWLAIAAIMVFAVVMSVHGSVVWMLVASGVFLGLFAKYGCAAH